MIVGASALVSHFFETVIVECGGSPSSSCSSADMVTLYCRGYTVVFCCCCKVITITYPSTDEKQVLHGMKCRTGVYHTTFAAPLLDA